LPNCSGLWGMDALVPMLHDDWHLPQVL